MHRQALGLIKTVLGKEHPSTLASMNNLALVLRDQGRYEQVLIASTVGFATILPRLVAM
jgi:hypothetical protein